MPTVATIDLMHVDSQTFPTSYDSIRHWYVNRLHEHGDTHLGIGWPDQEKAETKYRIMLELIPPNQPASLLDFGCGPGRMLDWMKHQPPWSQVRYAGLDFNADSLELARRKHRSTRFIQCDIFRESFDEHFDYVVMNGVLTMKAAMSFEQMWEYARRLIAATFRLANVGIAFNVMSKAVDWEKEILFHLPTDTLIDFLTSTLSRRFIIRQDYAPFEYTVYVYR